MFEENIDPSTFHTFFASRWTSRIDRIYAKASSKAKYINLLDRPDAKTAHTPVLFNIKTLLETSTAHRKHKCFKFAAGEWISPAAKWDLERTLPFPMPEESYDNLHKRMIESLDSEQKKRRKQTRKTICKLKKMVVSIPKGVTAHQIANLKLNDYFERCHRVRMCRLDMDEERHRQQPSQKLTRQLKNRARQQHIDKLKHPITGDTVHKQEDLKEAVHTFYKNLYSEFTVSDETVKMFLEAYEPPPPDTFDNIDAPISVDELKRAIKPMKNLKAPGVDGLPTLPYKYLCDEALECLANRFNEFMSGSTIPSEWKRGVITLLHKKGSRKEIGNYRPITLLRTDYKILSLILCRRIYPRILDHIGIEQVGFMPQRLIFDNVLCLNEVLKLPTKTLLSVDFKKAYDSVSHRTILLVMRHMGFPERFCTLIQNMLSGSQAQLIVNNELTNPFDIRRGVKQGDPLSPLLFTFVIEMITRFARNHFSGIKIGSVVLIILLYADDILLICKDKEELIKWIKVLAMFKEASGLEMNMSKSFYVADTQEDLPVPPAPTKFTYLGFLYTKSGLTSIHSQLLNRVLSSCARWKNVSWRVLTKLSIAKSYILSQLWYFTFIADMTPLATQMQDEIRKFLWFTDKGGRFKMSQKRLQSSTMNSGFGLWDLKLRFRAQWASICWSLKFNKNMKIGKIWLSLGYFEPNRWLYSIPNPIARRMISAYNEIVAMDKDILQMKKPRLRNWNDIIARHQQNQFLTKRQKNVLDTQKVNLGTLFTKLKRLTTNVPIREFWWHYCNGVLPTMSASCNRCGDKATYSHIFFDCHILRRSDLLADIICVLYNRTNVFIRYWNEKHTHQLLEKGDTRSFFIGIGLFSIFQEYRFGTNKFTNHLQKALSSDYYQIYGSDFPEIAALTQSRRFDRRWEAAYYIRDMFAILDVDSIGIAVN